MARDIALSELAVCRDRKERDNSKERYWSGCSVIVAGDRSSVKGVVRALRIYKSI